MSRNLVVPLGLIFCFLLFSGCIDNSNNEINNDRTYEDGDIKLINTEPIEGRYDTDILHEQIYYNGEWSNTTRIKYTKNENAYTGVFIQEITGTLNWIKSNTNKNCTILCWWDYGHMIEGYAERDAIATFASSNLKDTIASFSYMDENKKNEYIENNGGWNSKEKLEDIASVLTCFNISSIEIQEIIEKYNVSYIFTRGYDKQIAQIFFRWFDKNTSEYIDGNYLTDLAEQTLIFQLWADNNIPYGLELVYDHKLSYATSSGDIRLFKVVI